MKYSKNNLYVSNGTLKLIIMSYIVSLIYKILVVGSFGNDDIGRVGIISSLFYAIYLVIAYVLIDGISRCIKELKTKKKYKTIQNILYISTVFGLIISIFALVFTSLNDGFVEVKILGLRYETNILKVMVLPIIIMVFNSSLRGYFIGIGLYMANNFSIILESVVSVIVSTFYVFAYKSAKITDCYTGYTFLMGLFWGMIASYLFLGFIYMVNRGTIRSRILKSGTDSNDSIFAKYYVYKKEISKSIDKKFILTLLIYGIYKVWSQAIFLLLGDKEIFEKEKMLGINTKVTFIFDIVVFISIYFGICMLRGVGLEVVRKNFAKIRNMLDTSLRYGMLIVSPVAFLYLSMINKWSFLLQESKKNEGFVEVTVIYTCVSLLFKIILLITLYLIIKAKMFSQLLVDVGLSALLSFSVEVIILAITNGVFALVISKCLFFIILACFNLWRLNKEFTYKISFKSIGIPLISGAIAGLISTLVVNLMYALTGINILSIILGIIMGLMNYFIAIILFRGISKEEMVSMPKGKFVLKVSQKMHIV